MDIPRLWAVAQVQLGISGPEFLRLTPVEFFLLYDAYIEKLEIEDARFALLATILANANRGKRKPFKMEDFIPKRREAKKAKPRQTVEQQVAIAKAITIAFGGKIRKGISGPDPQEVRNALLALEDGGK